MPKKPKKLLLPAAVLAAVAAGLAGCGSSGSGTAAAAAASGKPVSGGSLTISIASDPICLDPQQSDLSNSLSISRQMVDSLVGENPTTGAIVPWLATSWTVNANATVFTFSLRHGVTFSDGEPLNAAAVKTSFDGVHALGAQATVADSYLAGYLGTKVINDYTVQISFAQSNGGFLQAASTMSLGILAPKTYKESAQERCQGTNLIGSGPFVLDSYTPNSQVVLSKRSGYNWPAAFQSHTGEAYLDTIVFKVVPETSVADGSLESGQLDAVNGPATQDLPTLSEDGFQIIAKDNPGTVSEFIVNNSAPILSDENVRKAIVDAINRQQIVSTLEPSQDKVATSILSSTTPDYANLSSLLPYDPAESKQLLQSDGWIVGKGGYRYKNGQELTITILNGQAGSTAEYQLVQQQLAAIGVNLTIDNVTRAAMLSGLEDGHYDLVPYGFTRADPDALLLDFSIKTGNLSGLKNSPLQADLDAMDASTVPAKRQAAATAAQEYILQNALVFPMVEQINVTAVAPYIHDLQYEAATRLNLYSTWTSK